MKTRRMPLPVSLALLIGVAATPTGAAAATLSTVVADAFVATFPGDCAGPPIATGLCLLGSTTPRTTDAFIVRAANGDRSSPQYPVQLNTRTYIPPGTYRLARQDDLDQGHESVLVVQENQVQTRKTATIKFQDSGGRYNKLQHLQARDGINGAGCRALVGA